MNVINNTVITLFFAFLLGFAGCTETVIGQHNQAGDMDLEADWPAVDGDDLESDILEAESILDGDDLDGDNVVDGDEESDVGEAGETAENTAETADLPENTEEDGGDPDGDAVESVEDVDGDDVVDGDDTDGDEESENPDIWIDEATGYHWQTVANDPMTFDAADAHCIALDGLWHLPDIVDLRQLIQGCDYTVMSSPDKCGIFGACQPDERLDECYDDYWCNGCIRTDECYSKMPAYASCGEFWSSRPVYWGAYENQMEYWAVDFERGAIEHYRIASGITLPFICVLTEVD